MNRTWLVVIALTAGCERASRPEPAFAVAAPATAVAVKPAPPPSTAAADPPPEAARACLAALITLGRDDSAEKCHAGDGQSCHRAATASDSSCRTTLLEHACSREEGLACAELAGILLAQRDDALRGRSLELLQRGCELAAAKACTRLGQFYDQAPAVVPAGESASLVYERACSLGHAAGCRKAAEHEASAEAAASLYQRACERGDAKGCVEHADNIARTAVGAADFVRVKELLRRACAQDEDTSDEGEACARLHAYATSESTVADHTSLLARACKKGHTTSCDVLLRDAYLNGRYAEAIEPASQVVARAPDEWNGRYMRGMSLYYLGRFAEAVTDLESAALLRPDWDYADLLLFGARSRAGSGDAQEKLRSASKDMAKVWPHPVATYFLGSISEAELLRQAKHREAQRQLEQECEAFYYIGAKNLIDGDERKAARRFEQAIKTGITNFIEYAAAKVELDRMKKQP